MDGLKNMKELRFFFELLDSENSIAFNEFIINEFDFITADKNMVLYFNIGDSNFKLSYCDIFIKKGLDYKIYSSVKKEVEETLTDEVFTKMRIAISKIKHKRRQLELD